MIIDHLGVVVRSLDEGVRQWTDLFGYTVASETVTNTRQKVRVVFLKKPNSLMIKLIEPTDATSPIYAFARKGGGLHHLCFRCQDIGNEIPLLKSKGARFLVPPEPGEAFLNHNIAFFLAANNLNVELIDTDEKVSLRP